MKKLLKIISSKGYSLFCMYLSAFMAISDAFAKKYVWALFWVFMGVWSFQMYKARAKAEGKKLDKSSCPPHIWDVQDGFIHCTKCGDDLQRKK